MYDYFKTNNEQKARVMERKVTLNSNITVIKQSNSFPIAREKRHVYIA